MLWWINYQIINYLIKRQLDNAIVTILFYHDMHDSEKFFIHVLKI